MSTVTLGEFTCAALERYQGPDLAAGVRAAAVHYAAKLRSGRAPVPPAEFLPGLSPEAGGVRIELTLDSADSSILEREAAAHGISVGRLLAHTVLVYLAEIELLGVLRPTG